MNKSTKILIAVLALAILILAGFLMSRSAGTGSVATTPDTDLVKNLNQRLTQLKDVNFDTYQGLMSQDQADNYRAFGNVPVVVSGQSLERPNPFAPY